MELPREKYCLLYTSDAADEEDREIGNADIRVIRGGSWKDKVIKCRSASRTFFKITMAGNSVGFRIVAKPRESYNLGR